MLSKRRLGGTGMLVSVLGLGTVKLGRNRGVKYPASFHLPDDREAADLLSLAQELGINLIDTAPAYGTSEERLGKLLTGQRDRWLICSKVGEEFVDGRSRYDFSAEYCRFSIERSLKRLNTDVVDMVLVHSDGNDLDIINRHGTLDALARLKSEGKIRAYGMSTKTLAGGLLAAEKSDLVMVTWNLQHDAEVPVIDYCYQHGKGVLIKKALASGHVCLDPNENPVEKSFAMILGHPGVGSIIAGTIDPAHLRANVRAASGL